MLFCCSHKIHFFAGYFAHWPNDTNYYCGQCKMCKFICHILPSAFPGLNKKGVDLWKSSFVIDFMHFLVLCSFCDALFVCVYYMHDQMMHLFVWNEVACFCLKVVVLCVFVDAELLALCLGVNCRFVGMWSCFCVFVCLFARSGFSHVKTIVLFTFALTASFFSHNIVSKPKGKVNGFNPVHVSLVKFTLRGLFSPLKSVFFF
jgi:hypothetical protein